MTFSLPLAIIATLFPFVCTAKPIGSRSDSVGLERRDGRSDLATQFGLDYKSKNDKPYCSRNDIYVGLFSNDKESLTAVNTLMQTSFAFYGVYAQLPGDRLWNAAELTQAVTTARDTGAILQVSLRPNPTWWGLTDQDNSQAKQIAQFLQDSQAKIQRPVWLRFAPDMNLYQTKGGNFLYGNDRRKLLKAWQQIRLAINGLNNVNIKMIWSPSLADDDQDYEDYWPSNAKPDIVALSYRPVKAPSNLAGELLQKTKAFHDRFARAKRPFVISQASLDYKSKEKDRLTLLKALTHRKIAAQLPYYVGATVYNYPEKKEDGRITSVDTRIVILPEEEQGYTDRKTMNALTYDWVHEEDA